MKAVVLAAGLGTRLHPVTQWIPKPMVPLFGRPILEWNLRQLRQAGITEVIVNLHHHPLQIVHHLGDGSSLGLRIHYSLEPQILGTAGGLKKVEKLLEGGAFLVVNADTFRRIDIRRMLRFHRKKGGVLTLLLQENPHLAASRAIRVDRRGRIRGFLDLFPERRQAKWRKMEFLGVQVVEPEVLSFIPRGQPWEMRRVFAALLHAGMPLQGFVTRQYWQDLGTLGAYRQIHVDVLEGRCPLPLPASPVDKGVWMGRGIRLRPGAVLDPPVFVGEGCVIGSGARIGPHAVLGRECIVGTGARVVRSILWDGARVSVQEVVEDQLLAPSFRCALPPLEDPVGS